MRRWFVLVTCLVIAAPAHAQRVEISASGGFTASEGVEITDRALLGQVYDTIAPASGSSFNVTAGLMISEALEVEFLFGQQNSQLEADGPGAATRPVAELTIYNYHGNIVYNLGPRDGSVRPFVFFGAGVTTYAFGATLVSPPAGGAASLDSDTRFSSALGGGAKFYFLPAVGLRVAARWTPTYIKTDADGLWCDPFYGCWPLGDPQYSNQFDSSAGITVRF